MKTRAYPYKEIAPNPYEIGEFDCASIFLLIGDEKAMVIDTEEFWELCTADTDLASLRSELLAWVHTYNHIRPHQALAYLTPSEFLAKPPPVGS